MWLAFLVLLTNSVIEIPPSEWKAIDLPISRHETIVDCHFEVNKGSRVQVLLTDREQAARFHRGRSFRPLYATGFANDGHFRYRVREAGNYVLIVDNRIEGRFPTEVAFRVELFSPPGVKVQELPPERRRLVVTLSLVFFGFVVAFSALQFLKHT